MWMLLAVVSPAFAQVVSFSLDTIRHEAFEADRVQIAFDAARRGEADIRVGRLRVAGVEYKELRLHCSGFHFDGRRLDCPTGTLRRDDERGRDRPPLPFSLAYRSADKYFEFALRDVEVVDLSPLVKRLRGWKPEGRVDFRIVTQGGKANLHLGLRGIAFASKDGAMAGKDIALTLDAEARKTREGWDWQASVDWPQGELTRKPWQRAAGMGMSAQGALSEDWLDVRQLRVEEAGVGAVTASLRWDRQRDEAAAWGLVTEQLDLATAMRNWVQPWLAELGFPAWRTSGKARFAAEWGDGRLRRFHAGLEDATLADATGYIELRGMHADIPWQDGVPGTAEFGIAAGRFGELPLGAFTFPLHIEGRAATIRGLTAPLLDGSVVIEELALIRAASGWQAAFSGGIDGVSMPRLSRTLGLPLMAGSLTARIPRIAFADGNLSLDGALAIQVFDGGITVHRLRVIDALSAQRRLLVDVTARNLDLGMLTQTFSFGSIAGRFDADLNDLEMTGWQPRRFAARIASSPGDYPRYVSVGALRDIVALGENKPGGALDKVPERGFGGFGYARIAIGATLQNGVCLLDGVSREGEGVVLMEGSGLPAVRIIGYNPRIDWEALVARIREVRAGKPGVVIE